MKSFFKIFFATLLAIFIFCTIAFFILLGIGVAASSSDKPVLNDNSVLVIDLSKSYHDFENPSFSLNLNIKKLSIQPPSLYDVIRMINYAQSDKKIKGIYIQASVNPNGFASSEELRRAISEFKQSGKFVIAYGATITQKAYYVASVANKVYTNPQGGLEWHGMASQMMFFKGLFDKLGIQPEVFYAGKFKSATEPFRVTKMTDPNKLQTSVWLGDLYGTFLEAVAKSRNIDSAQLHLLANNGSIQTAGDALKYGLVDSLIYTDQLENNFHQLLKTKSNDKINFITLDKYAEAADYKSFSGKDRIAVVYAQGEIVDGTGDNDKITSDKYVNLLRKLRKDSSVKAIVMRVNSPGGSALASDMIWREITLTKKIKPVIISMGDLAASGGYYISCNGSFIFAEPNTITGSIGVFSITGNAEDFFKNKLGLTFDVVKTGPYADLGSIARPMTEPEKNFMQSSVDSIYKTFTERVAEGRKKPVLYIDSIAQGRVWTGKRGVQLGLVDSLGSLNDAIKYAARIIKTTDYRISEYPEKKSIFDQLFHSDENNDMISAKIMTKELGPEMSKSILLIKNMQTMINIPQTRLPFEFEVR